MGNVHNALSETLDPSEPIPGSAEVAAIPLIEACIAETLRLFPAVPGGLQRISPEKEDTVIQGIDGNAYVIPPNTHVHTCIWAMNRARWSGPSPESFSPQRFLHKLVDRTVASSTFGMGIYSCVGRNLALKEMRVVVGSLVRAFNFQFAEGFDPEKFLASYRDYAALNVADPLLVLVKKR